MEESFATALREARQSRGLSQDALADLAGLSGQAIGLLERGVRRHPQLTTLDKLNQALALSPDERTRFKRLASRTAAPVTATPAGPDWTVADQLPSRNSFFTGRPSQLDQLIPALAVTGSAAGATNVVTISGMPGVGKTALAVEAAHRCRGSYPDGLLFVNLRGFGSSTPLTTVQAITHLLRATGVPVDALPTGEAEAVAALRTRLANHRVLIVLDNARDVHQIADLIPSSNSSAVLITSRNTLTAQPARRHIQLDPMPVAESVQLLAQVAGPGRLDDSAEEISGLCGGLPLALSVAGAWLLRNPSTSAADLAHRLSDQTRRLDLLGVEDLDVRASLSLSIDQLTGSARPDDRDSVEAFTLLGLTPARDFTAETAAALLATSPARARFLLDHLTDLHLLETTVPGRYHFHDLVRTYAHELARQLPGQIAQAALDRSLAFFSAVVWRSSSLSDPKGSRNVWPGRPSAPPFPVFADAEQGLAWIDTELDNLLAIIEASARSGGRDEQAAGAVIPLYSYFVMRGNLAGWLPTIDQVVRGDIEDWTRAQLHADAAIALAELSRYEESSRRFQQARTLFEAAGNQRGVSLTANNEARVLIRMRRYADALPLVRRALDISSLLGNQRAMAAAHGTLIEVHTALEDWEAAAASTEAAIALYAAAGVAGHVANTRIDGAWARTLSGHPEQAVDDIRLSLSELQQLGRHKNVCDAHWILGMTYLRLRDFEAAIGEAELGLEIALDVEDLRRQSRLRLLLGELLIAIDDRDEAVAQLDAALAFFADHDPDKAAEAEELLRRARNGTSA